MRSASTDMKELGRRIRATGTTEAFRWILGSPELMEDGSWRMRAYLIAGDRQYSFWWRIEAGEIEAGIPGPTPREPAG
jgi:hypothetical protein